MKIVFMGTPEIAAVVLRCLIESKKHEILACVTQTDKPKGRGHELAFSEVKQVALEYNIPVLQPEKASDPEFIKELASYNADVICVVAYGKILKEQILNMPRFGCINVHASLLPKYRGAAPIQWAVINGEEKSGVTIMHMDPGIDTGDMIIKKEVTLSKDETAESLHDKLAEAGGPLLLEALDLVATGRAPRTKQDDAEMTYYGMIDKSMGKINFNDSAISIERLMRGLYPWPTAFTMLDGKNLKFFKAEALMDYDIPKSVIGVPNGTIIDVTKDSLYVLCGTGVLKVTNLQLEGKKRMDTSDFLRGYEVKAGTVLGK